MRHSFAEMIRAVAVAALLFFPNASATAERAAIISEYRWVHDAPGFGGFSGLSIADDGRIITTISDRAHFAVAEINRDPQSGAITDVELRYLKPLLFDLREKPDPFLSDAEGLATGPDGALYVSFEGYHRVLKYRALDQAFEHLHPWDKFMSLQNNSGFEALAVDDDGTLYAVPERSGAWERPFPVHRLRNGVWDSSLSIPRSGRFLPVGADIGPDGRFYLLERAFLWFGGFATRLRRFDIGDTGLHDEKTLLQTPMGRHENLEGISVWRGPDGALWATLISDDNFSAILSTHLVEYRLPAE